MHGPGPTNIGLGSTWTMRDSLWGECFLLMTDAHSKLLEVHNYSSKLNVLLTRRHTWRSRTIQGRLNVSPCHPTVRRFLRHNLPLLRNQFVRKLNESLLTSLNCPDLDVLAELPDLLRGMVLTEKNNNYVVLI